MRIRTRLIAVSWGAAILAVLVASVFFWTGRQMKQAGARQDLAREMLETAQKRAALRDEYLLYHDERPREQWRQQTEKLDGLMKSARAAFVSPGEASVLRELSLHVERTKSIFSRLLENQDRVVSGELDAPQGQEIERRAYSQIIIANQSLITETFKLQEISGREFAALQARNNAAILVSVLLLVGFTVAATTMVARSIALPLSRLKDGIEVIATGNLDHQVEAQSKDEIGELARAFNQMTARLKGVIVSRDELAVEVEKRRRLEAELVDTRDRLQRMVDASPAMIYTCEAKGDFNATSISGNVRAIMGYEPREFIAPGFWSGNVHPDDAPRVLADLGKLFIHEKHSHEYRFRHKNGSWRWMLDELKLLRDQAGEPLEMIGYWHDITERKLAEERIRKAVLDLERSNKELEQFAYVASHDLQEPLRMISSYSQLLAQRYGDQLDDKARKYIDYAVDGAVRMQRLINDLLTFSRIGTRGKPLESTDTHAVLGEAIRNLAAMIEENGAIVTNDDLPTVRADASQLVQVFQNLIANGIKFRGESGPHVHVSARDREREWVFSISDNGIGIDPQHKDRLFVIFQRLHTREEYPGTGIGLAVCKRIVERHGGAIWFESEPKKGSTFFFTLPKQ